MRSITLLWSSSQKKDHRGGARNTHWRSHYIPQQPVIRDQGKSTKMRIVYDCSAKANSRVSLNAFLEVGPPLQPMIFDILQRNRLRLMSITGYIQKAFVQIKVEPKDRDALRLLWHENLDSYRVSIHQSDFRVRT